MHYYDNNKKGEVDFLVDDYDSLIFRAAFDCGMKKGRRCY